MMRPSMSQGAQAAAQGAEEIDTWLPFDFDQFGSASGLGYAGGRMNPKFPLGPPSSRPVQVSDTGKPHEPYPVAKFQPKMKSAATSAAAPSPRETVGNGGPENVKSGRSSSSQEALGANSDLEGTAKKNADGAGRAVTSGGASEAPLENYDSEEDNEEFEKSLEGQPPAKQRQKRRLERNAREQRRSKRITTQIEQLRELLRASGRSVKANKASVLAETADFILSLQKQNASMQSEQFHRAEDSSPSSSSSSSSSSASSSAASDSASAAATSAESFIQANPFDRLGDGNNAAGGNFNAWMSRSVVASGTTTSTDLVELDATKPRVMTTQCYRLAFYDSGVPMAIATMDGCFVDCNKKFLNVSAYARDELLKLTIFNLTAPADLQQTFSQVSQMLRSMDDMPSFQARAVLKFNREQGSLAISLVRDDHRRPIYFSVAYCYQSQDEVAR